MGSIAVKAGHIEVFLIDDDRIAQHVLKKGSFEPDSLAAWVAMCAPGSEVLDIGAYSGLFSIAAAKRGARPIAIEPMPTNVERIKANAGMNGVKFTVIQAAATDSKGTADLGYNPGVYMTAGASLDRKGGPTIRVRTIPIDDMRFEKLSAIKIDVEHHELYVLRGAERTIAKHKPRLIVEALDDSAKKAVVAMLPGYRSAGIRDVRNVILEPI